MATVSASETATSSVPKLLTQNLSSTSSTSAVTNSSSSTDSLKKYPEFFWMVKPCSIYKEEYNDCKSFKARFHQYFVEGERSDCKQWKEDYDNCTLWEEKDDAEGLKKVIESEKLRTRLRLRSHYANDVWEHRTSPPSDWNKELPQSIRKGYAGSHLQTKAEELKNGKERLGNFTGDFNFQENRIHKEDSSCSIV